MRTAVLDAAIEALHEAAWFVVLAGQGVLADGVTPDRLYPPLPGELHRRRVAVMLALVVDMMEDERRRNAACAIEK